MNKDEVMALIKAGFSRDEILEMLKPEQNPEQEKEQEKEQKPEQEKEQSDPVASLKEELKSLRDEMHMLNIKNSKQPETVKTVDDILMDYMKGGN